MELNNEVFRYGTLVLTVARKDDGYEVLVEVDTDEGAPEIPVSISTANGDLAEVRL